MYNSNHNSSHHTYLNTLKNNSNSGFTLVEMMIVVAILGIIAAIAVPSYTNYVKDGRRTDMMSVMQNMASKIESQKIVQSKYENITLTAIMGSGVDSNGAKEFPEGSNPFYKVTISPINATKTNLSNGNWTMTATPISGASMDGDGNLSLSFNGTKCHDSTCSMDDGWRK